MRVYLESSLFDPGTAPVPEDGIWPFGPVFAVCDGVSTPYNDQHPPVLFDGLTGGQMASQSIIHAFGHSSPLLGIHDIIKYANNRIAQIQNSKGIDLNDASQLGGATFAFAQIGDDSVRIIQGGDCYAIWQETQETNGKVGVTPNLFRRTEIELQATIARLMKETNGDRKEMWRRFYPILCESRRKTHNVPGVCAVLNGQIQVENCWLDMTLPIDELSLLILCTDGLLSFSEVSRLGEEEIAKKAVEIYAEERLAGILAWTRRIEEMEAKTSHIDHAEATALAIRFK